MIEKNLVTTSLQNIIKKELKLRKRHYVEAPYSIIEHYNSEQKNIEAYNGRQLLEMLQNADDAAITNKEKNAYLGLQNNQLIIANNGEPFSEGGLISLLYSDLSPKVKEQNKIGQKGLGFRSVLSWADKVTIKSYDLHISFSKEHSISFLQELINENPDIKEVIRKKSNAKYPISILRCPKLENGSDDNLVEFDTVIKLDLKEGVFDEVQKQINEELDKEVILFLHNLEKIIINSPERKDVIHRKFMTDSTMEVCLEDLNGKVIELKKWQIKERKGKYKGKNYELKLAWNENLDDNKHLLYSYFKTNVRLSFPALIHGTFELNDNRNYLIKDTEEHNKFLLEELTQLLIDTALAMCGSGTTANYNPLKLLCIKNQPTDEVIDDFGFYKFLLNKIKDNNLFPSITNKYIKWDECPMFYKKPYADLLSPKDCPNLLKLTEDDEIIDLLDELKKFKYTAREILDLANKASQYLNTEQYAQLLRMISEDYESEITGLEDIDLPPLFFNENKKPLLFNSPIFFPKEESTSISSSFTKGITIQFISEELAVALKKEFDAVSYGDLCNRIPFDIKPYSFVEIATLIINYYQENPTKANIQRLHSLLFELYDGELSNSSTVIPKLPSENKLLIINRKGQVRPISVLYFGKDYGQDTTEELYKYDRGKFIGSQKQLKLENFAQNDLKKYLQWLGCAAKPRKCPEYADTSYADFCMKNYDFKKPINYFYPINNYQQFNKWIEYYDELIILSYDGLRSILKNAESESILTWIHRTEDLKRNLVEDKEEDYNSKIGFRLSGTRKNRYIPSASMKSYVKWVFNETEWLQTKSGILASPKICTLSRTINSEFSPFIEVPKIHLDHPLFLRNKLKQNDIEYLLTSIGVHKDISTFESAVLYNILSNLSSIDPEGVKAKSIYNEIAKNYNDSKVDILSESYLSFINNGEVFCKHGNTFEYVQVGEVYYVDNKRYGDSIINQFATICIDRRQGKKKINKIFGVKPLEALKVELRSDPQMHPLNTDFGKEIEHFKPYVYAFRKDVDTRGSDRSLMKSVKFELCTDISATLILDDQEKIFSIEDFEFIYFPNIKSVYIKVPIEFQSMLELKNDMLFCGSISEAFSAILDVDSNRSIIRDLFSRNVTARDEIIRSELDDENLQKLDDSKHALDIISDPKAQFWKAFIKCFPRKKVPKKLISDEEWTSGLNKIFPALADKLDSAFEKINYSNINDLESLSIIHELFMKVGLTAEQFNKYVYPEVDFSVLHQDEFQNLVNKAGKKFKGLLYRQLQTKTVTEKEEFLHKIDEYQELNVELMNLVELDLNQILQEKVLEEFGVDLNAELEDLDLHLTYQDNKFHFIQSLDSTLFDDDMIINFLDDYKNDSLVYFAEFKDLQARFKSWLVLKVDSGGKGKKPTGKAKRLTINSNPVYFNDFEDLIKQLDENNQMFNKPIKRIQTEKCELNPKQVTSGGHRKKKRNFGTTKRIDEDLGFLGEYAVFNSLKESEKNVEWISEYARKAGINYGGKMGQGYDLTYESKNGKTKYVEVKVVGGQDVFHLTNNEAIRGQELKEHYEVFLVRDPLNPASMSIEKLTKIFKYKAGQTFNDNDNFSVENDNFLIKFKRK
jgi:uncharacterized protein DUF3883